MLYYVRVHSNKNTRCYSWTCHLFNRDIVFREERKMQVPQTYTHQFPSTRGADYHNRKQVIRFVRIHRSDPVKLLSIMACFEKQDGNVTMQKELRLSDVLLSK